MKRTFAGAVAPIPDGTYARPATSGALAARPAATVIGQRYLASDIYGGTVYESLDGSTWTQMTAGLTASVPLVASAAAAGFHRNTDSATYGQWFTVGNAPGSVGFAGTGTPAEGYAPFVVYQKYGDSVGGTNAPVLKTTQACYMLANYYGPTADDSAECLSAFVGVKNTGTAFAQTKPATAFEAIAQVEGANTMPTGVTGMLLGIGSRINVLGTSNVSVAAGFKASVNSSGGPTFGTIGTYIGFYQPISAAALGGTVSTAYGVYVADAIVSETRVALGASGNTGSISAMLNGNADVAVSMLYVKGPDSAPGLTQLSLAAGSTQTRAMFAARDSGGTTRVAIAAAGTMTCTGTGFNINTSGGVNVIAMQGSVGMTITDVNVILSATTGTKWGTATTQKQAWWGHAAVVQPSGTPADATDLATVITLANFVKNSVLLATGLAA